MLQVFHDQQVARQGLVGRFRRKVGRGRHPGRASRMIGRRACRESSATTSNGLLVSSTQALVHRRSVLMANLLNTLGFDRLPRSDRLELVQDLWGSIAAEGPPALTEAQRRELERRVAEDDAN